MRIFFATDVHGSETCWRKFLNAAAHYKADVLILGGDMTGKALVPIIHDGGDNWHATLLEVRSEMTTEEEVAAFEDRVIRRGSYRFRTGRARHLQLPPPAVSNGPGRRARTDGGHDAQGRRTGGEAGRLHGGTRGDRGAQAGADAARAHPRVARQLPHRPNALH